MKKSAGSQSTLYLDLGETGSFPVEGSRGHRVVVDLRCSFLENFILGDVILQILDGRNCCFDIHPSIQCAPTRKRK